MVNEDDPLPDLNVLAQIRTNLDIFPEDTLLGATIDLAPTFLVHPKLSGLKEPQIWERFTPLEQRNMLIEYINKVYVNVDSMLVAFEFTKKLMIHAHLLIVIKDDKIHIEDNLRTLQVMVRRKHIEHGFFIKQKYTKHMNYIHTLEQKGPSQWLGYLIKKIGTIPKGVYCRAAWLNKGCPMYL